MKYTAIDNFDNYWFVPTEQGKDDAVEFFLKPLNSPQTERLQEGGIRDDLGQLIAFKSQCIDRCLRESLLDWKNYKNSNGDLVEFSFKAFDNLPVYFREQITTELYIKNIIPESVTKNS